MSVDIIPLVGSINTRNVNPQDFLTKDQIFSRVMLDVVTNGQTGKRTIYANKFPGFATGSTLSSGNYGLAIEDQFGFYGISGPCTAFRGSSNVDFYVGTTLIGSSAHFGLIPRVDISKAQLAGENHFLIAFAANTGFYIGTTGLSGNSTFTGDTHTNTTIDNVSSTTGLVVGQLLSGTGIAADTRIASISGTTITTTVATTASNSGVTITRERMSKILSSNFPSIIGPFIELDGYVFIAENGSQKIYQSGLNDIQSWNPVDFITANKTNGILTGLSKNRDLILAHCADGVQFFRNAGNPSGSVLSLEKASTLRIGNQIVYGGGLGGQRQGPPFSTVNDLTFVMMDGIYLFSGEFKKISTDAIDRAIANTSALSIILSAFMFLGRPYLLVVLDKTTDIQYLYDVENNFWSYAGFPSKAIISKNLGYAIYKANDGILHYFPWVGSEQTPVYQDDGAAYTMTIQTSGIDHGTNKRKTVSRITLDADTQASGTATLEASDDDFANFVTLGSFDMTAQDKFLTRCGSHKGARSYRIKHSANTPFRGRSLRIEYKVGT